MKRYVDRHLVHLLKLPFTEAQSHRLLYMSLPLFLSLSCHSVTLLRK